MTMATDWDQPRDIKGLAEVLGRSRCYVQDMKACGFIMPGGKATLRMAFDWLAKHEDFTREQAAIVRFARRKAASLPVREQMGTTGNTDALALRVPK